MSRLPQQHTIPTRDIARRDGRRYRQNLWPWLAISLVVAAAVFGLHIEGRRWWCSCGELRLWSQDAWGPHNSQHLFDPYSLTHILHGILYCGMLTWACPRLSFAQRLWIAVALAAIWEVFENSDFVILRYRTGTIALSYTGDTIVNSLGDILMCAIGFLLAWRLAFWRSLVLFVMMELVLLIWIRDSLLLNIIMLIHPIEAVKAWQMV